MYIYIYIYIVYIYIYYIYIYIHTSRLAGAAPSLPTKRSARSTLPPRATFTTAKRLSMPFAPGTRGSYGPRTRILRSTGLEGWL